MGQREVPPPQSPVPSPTQLNRYQREIYRWKNFIPKITQFSPLSLSGFLSVTTVLCCSPSLAATVGNVQFIGQGNIAGVASFGGTTIGGLSGLAYSGMGNTYYGISDDPINPRFYTIDISVDSGMGTVTPSVTDVTSLQLSDNTVDAEGIAVVGSDIFVASEGIFNGSFPDVLDTTTLIVNPFVNGFDINGNQNAALTLPSRYTTSTPMTMTNTGTGVRNNLSLESLTITPDESKLFTATEAPLREDQSLQYILPASQGGNQLPPLIRILEFDENGNTYSAGAEYLYEADSVHNLVELLAVDNDTLLALERSGASEPYSIRLYELSLAGATDISSNNGLGGNTTGISLVSKTLLLDFSTLSGNPLDPIGNFEGLTFGPTLPNGETLLLAVSDNNLVSSVSSRFAAFSVKIASQTVPESSNIVALLLLGLGLSLVPKIKKG